ncbi:hypothetical protein GA0115254_126877, partial [Streptomyces sp. Ncost-T10-10d]
DRGRGPVLPFPYLKEGDVMDFENAYGLGRQRVGQA